MTPRSWELARKIRRWDGRFLRLHYVAPQIAGSVGEGRM